MKGFVKILITNSQFFPLFLQIPEIVLITLVAIVVKKDNRKIVFLSNDIVDYYLIKNLARDIHVRANDSVEKSSLFCRTGTENILITGTRNS